jgi:hypothetical protein
MAKKVAAKNHNNDILKYDSKVHKYLIAFPVIALLIKIIVMFNIQAGGWAGADGENYLRGVDGLLNEGFFSKENLLNYWPAGYPLMIWPLASISLSKFVYMISLIQSLLFAYATYAFTSSILKSSLKKMAFLTSLLISFNPTLSLSSLAIGYESPVASLFMISLALIIKNLKEDDLAFSYRKTFTFGLIIGLISFMQPRYALVGFIMLFILSTSIHSRKLKLKTLIIGLLGILLLPSLLIFRNTVAVDHMSISSNLGVTMAIGAGDTTSGGYTRSGPEVPCDVPNADSKPSDSELVKCVLKWYVANPTTTLKLAVLKSRHFWSPWAGPLADGTMARNPWLKISPVQDIKDSPEGERLVFGNFGLIISYLWIFSQVGLLILGYLWLRSRDIFSKQISNLTFTPIILSWIISIGTIGDHRFRLPTMALSLFLQGAGILAIRSRFLKVLAR